MELVRQALAMRPRATGTKIKEMLAASGITLDYMYINRLKKKIMGERAFRFNQAEVNVRIAEIQDKTNAVQQKLWAILVNPKATDKNKVAAARGILDAERKLFESELDAGLFERKLGEVEVRHGLALSPEQRQMILNAMANFGVIKKSPVVHEQIEDSKPKSQ